MIIKRINFDWDHKKDAVNQYKHGVSFTEAQYAFVDPMRVIAEDLVHSQIESRYYCFGKISVSGGILTVRFTYRDYIIRIYGAGFWRKGVKIYEQAQKNKIH